jgi:hypothetical protein
MPLIDKEQAAKQAIHPRQKLGQSISSRFLDWFDCLGYRVLCLFQ